MPAMQMSTIENAIWTWVQTNSGLAANRVIWAGQNQPDPGGLPYITLRLRVIRVVGSDWTAVEPNPTPYAGAEILTKVRGHRRCSLDIQCFADGPIGSAGPAAILNDVLTSVALPSQGDALSAAGIGMANFGNVQTIDGVVGSTRFEPRAIVQVSFYAVSELVETGTYIEHVEITRESPTPVETWTVSG